MSTVWDLIRLRSEIRNITGLFDTSQMSDEELDNHINDFYLYDFPEELRSLRLKGYYEFNTIPNVSTYTFQQNTYITNAGDITVNNLGSNRAIYNVLPPVYVDGFQSAWYQDPDTFQRIWPDLNTVQKAVEVTDGIESQFTFTLSATPILQGSVLIGCSRPNATTPIPTEAFRDLPQEDGFTNPGQLYRTSDNAAFGSINYLTGEVTIEFSAVPQAGIPINAHFYPYVASRPRDILFYNQKLTVRPVPQDVYKVKMVAQYQPTVLLNTGAPDLTMFDGETYDADIQSPLYFEWWQLLVYGTSMKIFIRFGDHEEAARYQPYYDKQRLDAQRRTLKQMSNQRIATIYSDGQASTAPFPPYPIN